MVCPNCKVEVKDELIKNGKCPFCEYKLQENMARETSEKIKMHIGDIHAKRLNMMANVNIVLSIIGAMIVLVSYFSEYYSLNIYVISIAIGILIFGFTQYYLLKTVVDIYNKEKR